MTTKNIDTKENNQDMLRNISSEFKSHITDARPFSVLWESSPSWRNKSKDTRQNVAVLDASFDPITHSHIALSHLAITCSSLFATQKEQDKPAPLKITTMFIHSVANADKPITRQTSAFPAHATFDQRFHMMALAAKDITEQHKLQKEQQQEQEQKQKQGQENSFDVDYAVCCYNEPLFSRKAEEIAKFLSMSPPTTTTQDSSSSQEHYESPLLLFIMGWDTIIRFFAPKYYKSLEEMHVIMDRFFRARNARIICARRDMSSYSSATKSTATATSTSSSSNSSVFSSQEEEQFFHSKDVYPYYKAGFIRTVDLNNSPSPSLPLSTPTSTDIPLDKISSTDARASIKYHLYPHNVHTEKSSIPVPSQFVTPSVLEYIKEVGLYCP